MWLLAHLHLLLHLQLLGMRQVRKTSRRRRVVVRKSRRAKRLHHSRLLQMWLRNRRGKSSSPINDLHPHRIRVHSMRRHPAPEDRIHQPWYVAVGIVSGCHLPVVDEQVEVLENLRA